MKKQLLLAISIATLTLGGCHWDMWVQSKSKTQEGNVFWEKISNNPSSTRAPLTGTIPFGGDQKNSAYYTGFDQGRVVKEFPIPVTKELIARGKDRFTIFCTPCHGQLGDGKGMIAQRGFTTSRPVATYHTARLRQMPVGHFFDVMTTGFGAMYPFAARIPTRDRWAIASYIRVLQFSQYAPLSEIDDDKIRQALGPDAASAPKSTGKLFVSPDVEPTSMMNELTGAGSPGTKSPEFDKAVSPPPANTQPADQGGQTNL